MRARKRILCVAGFGLLAAVAVAPALADDDSPVIEPISGVLETDGDDYWIGDVEVDFGPPWHIGLQPSSTDYNGDGTTDTIAAELDSLVGTTVAIDGERGRGGDLDVYSINGSEYRDPLSGPPAWAGGPGRDDDAVNGAEDSNGGPPPWAGGPPPWAGGDDDDEGDAGPPDWAGGPPPWAGGDDEPDSD